MVRHLVRRACGDVWNGGPSSVRPCQLESPLVDINRPDLGTRRLASEGDRDRPIAAAEVQDVSPRGRRRRLPKQDQSPEVNGPRAEYAAVRLKLEREFTYVEVNFARFRLHGGCRVEVMRPLGGQLGP